MYTVRTTGHLHKSKLFNFKLRSVRDTAHKNSTPSKARRPRLVQKYASTFRPDSNTLIPQECPHHYLRKKRRSEKKQLLAKPIY